MQRQRAQSGLDRLLVVVISAIVLVAVLPTVLGVAGIDVRESPATPAATPAPTSDPATLTVLNVSGFANESGADTLGAVSVTVTKAGSDSSVDVGTMSATWANGGVYTLFPVGAERANADGRFGVDVRHISNSSGRILAETGDTATLTFDIGDDDVDGVPEFGKELQPGDSVDLILATATGKTTTVSITAPASLDGKTLVGL